MKTERLFLIAPSLVRLILRERLVSKTVVEGYLAPASERTHFIRLEPSGCNLVLQVSGPDGSSEQRTKVPSTQAEALLEVCSGKVGYRRTHIRVGPGAEALLDRFEEPGALDLVTVEFEHPAEAQGFAPPGWFGPEVTHNPAYQKARMALAGLPDPEEVEVTNASVIALVETLEAAAGARQQLGPHAEAGADSRAAGNGGSHHEVRQEARPETARPVFTLPERPAVPVRPAVPPAASAPAPGTVAPLPDPRFDEVLAGLTEALETAASNGANGSSEAAETPDAAVEMRRTGSRGRR
jgi:CYTH domain-containing protein